MKYKALILDVDGTLTPPSSGDNANIPSSRVTAAIKKAQTHIFVGIATARPLSMLSNIFNNLSLNGYSILSNGALIIDGHKKIVWEKPLNPQSVTAIFDIGAKHNIHILTSENQKKRFFDVYFDNIPDWKIDSIEHDLSFIKNISTHRIVLYDKPGLQGLQITHPKATKQHAIIHVAKLLDIETKEIIGVGDGPNDFPLLMACGLRIAMGNAVPELKAIADFIAPSVEEDGVATIIDKFILNQ